MSTAFDGVLVVDKPAGITSHDVVARVRRISGERRIGHGGTLDPLATGVLPLVLGVATRLVRFLPADPKIYQVGVRLGFETNTGDIEGTPLGPPRSVSLSDLEIVTALRRFEGPGEQVPPMFSARKVAGRPLYRSARAGIEVERKPTPIRVDSLRMLSRDNDEIHLEVRCSPGTYVRSLVVDLGRSLGTLATVVALRRTRSGGFEASQACPLADLADPAAVRDRLLPLDRLPLGLSDLALPSAQVAGFRAGQAVVVGAEAMVAAPIDGLVAVRDPGGCLVGVGLLSAGAGIWRVAPRLVLARADVAR